ncbi:MAG: dimethylarginine dimethylaminohydrolase family protein [Polyangiales bacterium]
MIGPRVVLVRELSSSYRSCIRTGSEAIDLERAREQHAQYVASLGLPVEWLPPLDGHPDAVFVEDTAVILGRSAVITRPGAESRRGETHSVARALAAHMTIHTMEAPATLDGGDVLRVGKRLFVGLSGRTNRAGFDFLAARAREEGIETIAVDVARGLHLKSGCTIADEETLLCHRPSIDPASFTGMRIVEVDEPAGANVLALGKTILGSNAAPRTLELLAKLGFAVRAVEVSEIHKGDGALTCLSLRVPAAGSWAT